MKSEDNSCYNCKVIKSHNFFIKCCIGNNSFGQGGDTVSTDKF